MQLKNLRMAPVTRRNDNVLKLGYPRGLKEANELTN